MIEKLRSIVGAKHVLTGSDTDAFSQDWLRQYHWAPLAVVRPSCTDEIAALLRLANNTYTPVVPVAGHTGLVGGTRADAAIMVSLDRMNEIREIRPDAKIAIVEAGVILSDLHEAAEAHDLIFPLTFGAKGSAMIGGCLSTNAGGSNVVRYGNTRDQVLGIEVVLPTGEVMNLMSELRKDNSGYDLRHLLVGAEGTLGIITAAVLKLAPKPKAYATALVATPSLNQALVLLNLLQEATGGAVEAFEYMPGTYIDGYLTLHPGARAPFDQRYDVNVMVEVGAISPRDAFPAANGEIPIVGYLENVLSEQFEKGMFLDAVVAQNDQQRSEMWALREAAAEVSMQRTPFLSTDIAVSLDKVQRLLEAIEEKLQKLDPGCRASTVAHLGDGNIHHTIWPASGDPAVHDAIIEAVEELTVGMGGSFSAEHGIGTSKLPSMQRRKSSVAMQAMRAIKMALDPNGILNPGKVIPTQE